MNLREALSRASQILIAANIEEARFESEVLLRHALNINRVQLYQETGRALTPTEEEAFRQAIERRSRGEPTAYITGHREFYGLDFCTDSRALIPRPESELLVEESLRFAREGRVSVLGDIGTGSGAIAISLALNLPLVKVYATDISPAALELARINCQKHGLENRIALLCGDLLEVLPEPADLITANLPYVRKSEIGNIPSAKFEPNLALDGGQNGLDQIFRLSRQVKGQLREGGCLLLEVGLGQSQSVSGLLKERFPLAEVKVIRDYSGIDRVVACIPVPHSSTGQPRTPAGDCHRLQIETHESRI